MAPTPPALAQWLDDNEHFAVGFDIRRVASPQALFENASTFDNARRITARRASTVRSVSSSILLSDSTSTASPLISAKSSGNSKQSSASDLSTRKSSSSSSSSSSAESTTASTAPSEARYDLPCEFEFSGCRVNFLGEDGVRWRTHERSHFGSHGPPPRATCLFCDEIFDMRDIADRERNWAQRMNHIQGHYAMGSEFGHSRPDFYLVNYMRDANRDDYRLSAEDHEEAKQLTERAYCDGLVTPNFKTPEMLKRARRDDTSAQVHDQRREDRERRGHRRERF